MDTNTIEIAAIVAVVVIAIIAVAVFVRSRNSAKLRSRFGPEYVRAMAENGDQRHAEAQLQARSARVRKYQLHALSVEDRERFSTAWRRIQGHFVDDPRDAAEKADGLLGEVMSARGYPDDDFDQRLEDLSVDHAETVQEYRVAHDVAEKHARGDASTEDMRQAMIRYRTLFAELLGEPAPLKAAS